MINCNWCVSLDISEMLALIHISNNCYKYSLFPRILEYTNSISDKATSIQASLYLLRQNYTGQIDRQTDAATDLTVSHGYKNLNDIHVYNLLYDFKVGLVGLYFIVIKKCNYLIPT